MVELKKITEENFKECIKLDLEPKQWEYIAHNAYSLSEAYAINNDGIYKAMPFAIYNDDVMVGFIMAEYQPMNENDPDDYEDSYYISRTMIDKRYQGQGYGRRAMIKMIELMKTFPYGNADAVILSCSKENTIAFKLYESLGFVDTGEYDCDGDILCRLELK